MRSCALRFGIVASSLALAACSLVVDTRDLTRGDDSSPTSALDGVLPQEDEDPKAEGGRAIDAGADANAGAPSSPCAASQAHTFCEDFDPDVSRAWKQEDVVSAFLSTSNARSVSSPSSIHAEKRDGASPGRARLIADLPPLATRTTCELDVFVVGVSPDSALLMLFALAFRSGNDYLELDIRTSRGRGASLLEFGTVGGTNVDRSTNLSSPIPMARWAHLRLDVRMTPAPTFAVSLDGREVLAPRPLLVAVGASTQIYAGGVLEFGSGMTWDVYADNVVCDVRP